jgi:ribonuclease HIII
MTCMNKVLKLTSPQLQHLEEAYPSFLTRYQDSPIRSHIRLSGCVITLYHSGSVVFQGNEADVFYEQWSSLTTTSYQPHIGSDEVGTGDFFGPMVVCAAFVNAEHEAYLKNLGVGDSKGLDDAMIERIAVMMIPLIPHRQVVLMPEYYNKLYRKHPNLNVLKALLHNRALVELTAQIPGVPIIMDQFVHEAKYYEYLAMQKTVQRNIQFHTQAESKFIAVAAASVLARYYFLQSWRVMEQSAGIRLPKGAGADVERVAKQFLPTIEKHAWEHYVKLHFKTLEKINLAG